MPSNNNPVPKDLSNPQKIEALMPVGGSDQPRETRESFKALMKAGDNTPIVKEGATNSPFDLARGVSQPHSLQTPSLATIQTQVTQAQSSLGDLNNMLTTPGLKIKPSTKHSLTRKLDDATQQLRAVNAKVGGSIDEEGEQFSSGKSGPLQKFLGYISAGQASLAAAQKKISNLAEQGDQMNPAEFLLIQIKLNKAQQLLDYSSILLSKAVDDMKMMFNVQL